MKTFITGIISAATECEETHKRVNDISRLVLPDPLDEGKYFRFNYGQVVNKGGHWEPESSSWLFGTTPETYTEETHEELIDLADWKKMKDLRGTSLLIELDILVPLVVCRF